MENNLNSSSSKRTKHINICLFFITECISRKELNIQWCPTNEMIGKFMTKPMHRSIFNKFRDLIIGVVPIKKDIQEGDTKKSVSEYLVPETRRHK